MLEVSMLEVKCGRFEAHDRGLVNDGLVSIEGDLILMIPDEVVHGFLVPALSDAAAVRFSSTSSGNRSACAFDLAARVAKAYDESWKRGYGSPMAERAFNGAIVAQAVEMNAAYGVTLRPASVVATSPNTAVDAQVVAIAAVSPNAAIG
eukprot:scaffold36090_cov67-Phaeocystis_antarctica.AAC.1